MKESTEYRALTIAAKIMQAAGLCRYEDYTQCRHVYAPTDDDCVRCIRRWLITRARRELRLEGKDT